MTKSAVLAGAASVLSSLAFVLCTLALNAGSEDKTSDWISAFGTAFGAALTGGALLIAAFTYKHQVDERNRVEAERRRKEWDERSAEARGVTISFEEQSAKGQMECVVHNGGDVPVDTVMLVFDYMEARNSVWEVRSVGPLGPKTDSNPVTVPAPTTADSYCSFRDTKDMTWRLYFDGRLEEQVPDKTSPFAP